MLDVGQRLGLNERHQVLDIRASEKNILEVLKRNPRMIRELTAADKVLQAVELAESGLELWNDAQMVEFGWHGIERHVDDKTSE